MSADLGPGTWVECIEEDTVPGHVIHVGETFVIRRVNQKKHLEFKAGCTVHGESCRSDLLDLEGVTVHGWGWCSDCFRPINPGDGVSLEAYFRVREDA